MENEIQDANVIETEEVFIVEEFNKTKELESLKDVSDICKFTEPKILNQQVYDAAAVILSSVKAKYKELDEKRKGITKPMDAAKKAVMDVYKPKLDLLSDTEKSIKKMMLDYTDEQGKKAIDEQKRLQELADKETERQKKLLDARIEKAEASGKTDKVEELQAKKEDITPVFVPVISPQITQPKSVSYKMKWSARVIDETLVPREYLIVNQQALDKIAVATKGSLKIAGVEFISEKTLASK